MFRRNVIGMIDEIRASRCGMALLEITQSLNSGVSPAIYQGSTLPVHTQSYGGKTGAQMRAGCPTPLPWQFESALKSPKRCWSELRPPHTASRG